MKFKKSTINFVDTLRQLTIPENSKMCSLDIENMFPSIPLNKAIALAVDLLEDYFQYKLNKSQIKLLLEMCTKNLTY